MESAIEKEMYKPQVGYEMCGDKVFLVISQSEGIDEHRLVMTKDLFIACYEHWIKKVGHDRQLSDEKTGKWLNIMLDPDDITGHSVGECSVCGKVRIVDNYCPNCGARMENENEK